MVVEGGSVVVVVGGAVVVVSEGGSVAAVPEGGSAGGAVALVVGATVVSAGSALSSLLPHPAMKIAAMATTGTQ